MSELVVVKTLSDAVVLSYERTFDTLTVHLRLWDESPARLVAELVTLLQDVGTWEADGVIRVAQLDRGDGHGYAIVDTEGEPTLKFVAASLRYIDAGEKEHSLDGNSATRP